MNMEIATPRQPFNKRLSLVNTPLVSSPLRRSVAAAGSSIALLKPTDDEQERSTRRSIVEIQRKLTNVTSSTQSPLMDQSSLDEDQIKDHLRICVKLYTENRISAKNAWQLHVIDAMRKIASAGSANVLQVAGSSLDIGAKVYGLRVDDVHAKGLQLASSMSKSSEKQSAQEADEDNGLDVTTTEREKRRKKVKKLASDKRNTVDKEKKTLFASIQCVDSAVFATKESIDVSAADNLFTQKLPTNPSSHQLMILNEDKYWTILPDEILDGAEKNLDVSLPEVTHYNVCVPFKEFETGTWDPEEEERFLAEAPAVPAAILDDAGLPVAELDGSLVDIFQDNNIAEDPASDGDEHEEEFHAQVHGEIGNIVDAVPEQYRMQTDYGYNALVKTTCGKYIDKIWAGPSHWKVKFNRRSTPRYSGTSGAVIKNVRKIKVAEPIDFSLVGLDDTANTIVKHSVKRAPPTTTLDKITLPVPERELSAQYFEKITNELLIKPGRPRPIINNQVRIQPDCQVQMPNYDNPNEYCSRNSDFGDDGAPGPEQSFEEHVPPAAHGQFLEENLVNAPETVSSTHITYALQAKKMDMKKLKTAVWNSISQDSAQTNAKVKPIAFSMLYESLPRLLPTDMRKELTCPLAVVALLHLCNENNLILQVEKNYKDFSIRSAT